MHQSRTQTLEVQARWRVTFKDLSTILRMRLMPMLRAVAKLGYQVKMANKRVRDVESTSAVEPAKKKAKKVVRYFEGDCINSWLYIDGEKRIFAGEMDEQTARPRILRTWNQPQVSTAPMVSCVDS